eukprot:jgi/Tetstr1/423844/TSEL_014470.t1
MAVASETVFPLVLPTDVDLSAYEGPVTLPGRDTAAAPHLWLSLRLVPLGTPTLRGAILHCNTALSVLLAGQDAVVLRRLNSAPSVAAFFQELQAILQRQVGERASRGLPDPAYYRTLLKHIQELGWTAVKKVSGDLRTVTLKVLDEGARMHLVSCTLGPEYPERPPATEADLPKQLELRWEAGERSLAGIHRQYAAAVEGWQDLWDRLEDLDRHCRVLEPEAPRHCDLHRRVALGGFCSLSITLDADAPRARPDVRFLGSETMVAPLRARWAAAAPTGWQPYTLPRLNLEALLQVELPAPGGEAVEELTAACGICYSYLQDDGGGDGPQGPSIHCGNAPCGRPYHRTCLIEWLRSAGDSRQSFNILFGECVYCSHSLSVKLEEA